MEQRQGNQEYENQEQQSQQQNSSKEVLIRSSDMSPQEQCQVISISNAAIEEVADLSGVPQTQKFSKIAGIIKKQLDGRQGNGWYVICGKNFGTYVTHQYGSFIHFSFEDLHICAFRAH